MSWIKLHRFNDWGHVYFAEPGKGLSAHGTSDLRKYGLKFVEGAPLTVRWPDGSTTEQTVFHTKHFATVGDMGRSYEVEYALAGFAVSVRGVAKWVPLDEVELADRSLPSEGVATEK